GPGFAPSFNTTTTSGPSTLTVFATQLDNFGNPLGTQPLAGGLSVNASLASDNTTVATVTTPATITGGSDNATAQFTPKSVGTAKIRVATPTGLTPAPVSFLM